MASSPGASAGRIIAAGCGRSPCWPVDYSCDACSVPGVWKTGSVTGLKARGGFEVGLAWADGKLTSVKIKSTGGRTVTVRYGDHTKEIELKSGGSVQLNSELK